MRCPFPRQVATVVRSVATERTTDTGLLMRDMWRFLRAASMGRMRGSRLAYFRLKAEPELVTADLHSPAIVPLSPLNAIHPRSP
jgi:hypothetical protein